VQSPVHEAAAAAGRDEDDAESDSDAGDAFQVGTLSVRPEASKAMSVRPLAPADLPPAPRGHGGPPEAGCQALDVTVCAPPHEAAALAEDDAESGSEEGDAFHEGARSVKPEASIDTNADDAFLVGTLSVRPEASKSMSVRPLARADLPSALGGFGSSGSATPLEASRELSAAPAYSDSGCDSDADDTFQVGTLSVKPEMSKMKSVRPLVQADMPSVLVGHSSSSSSAKPAEANRQMSKSSESRSKHDDSDSSVDSDMDDAFQVGTLSIKPEKSTLRVLRPLDAVPSTSRTPSSASQAAEAASARGTARASSSSDPRPQDSEAAAAVRDEDDSESGSDRDGMFQVGTLSIKPDANDFRIKSLRPLNPLASRTPSDAAEAQDSPAVLKHLSKASSSSRRSADGGVGSSAAAKNVRHKFSRSSFGESSEESDCSVVGELPSKPLLPRSMMGRHASLPATAGTSSNLGVRAVASMPTGAGQRSMMHKQKSGRRLACTSSDLKAVAQASLSQGAPAEGKSSIRSQVEAMQFEAMQREWSLYDRERKEEQSSEMAACGTDQCTIS